MLYSYLLSRTDFSIKEAPESASRDIRYAHSAYIDLLLLLIELSGLSVKNERSAPFDVPLKLQNNRVGKALAAQDAIRNVILRGNSKVHLLDEVVPGLVAKIKASHVFDDYSRKKTHDLQDDVTFWVVVLETIIARDQTVTDALRADESFTNVGFEKAVKDVCATLKSYNDSRQLFNKACSDLKKSLGEAYNLYLCLFQLILDLTKEQADRLESAKNKYLVTSDDLNPNTRLIDNALVEYLRGSEDFNDKLADNKLDKESWHPLLVSNLLDKILESDIYKRYVAEEVSDFATDVEFWRNVMKSIILPSPLLAEELEDRSVFWNDDLEIMGTFVLKTLKKIATSEGRKVEFLPRFKNADDEKFGPDLFVAAATNREQYRKYIDMFIDNAHWDPERMAFMDIVIMLVAIAEIINYPLIPIPVTINEYVEIANHYSTEKSGGFINGILFSVINYLNQEGIINKK